MTQSENDSSRTASLIANVLFGVLAGLFVLYVALFYWHATRLPRVLLTPPIDNLTRGGLLFGHITVTVVGSIYIFFLAKTKLRGLLYAVILFSFLGLHLTYFSDCLHWAQLNWGKQATVEELASALDGYHSFSLEEAAIEEIKRRGPSAKRAAPALVRFIKVENASSFSSLAGSAVEALDKVGMDLEEKELELEQSADPTSP